MVYVNDQLKGTTPLTYDFLWYGSYRLTLRKEGYERLDDRRQLRAPLYLWMPLDLVMELLPFPIRDERVWSYTLNPAEAAPTPKPPEWTPHKPGPAAGGLSSDESKEAPPSPEPVLGGKEAPAIPSPSPMTEETDESR